MSDRGGKSGLHRDNRTKTLNVATHLPSDSLTRGRDGECEIRGGKGGDETGTLNWRYPTQLSKGTGNRRPTQSVTSSGLPLTSPSLQGETS